MSGCLQFLKYLFNHCYLEGYVFMAVYTINSIWNFIYGHQPYNILSNYD